MIHRVLLLGGAVFFAFPWIAGAVVSASSATAVDITTATGRSIRYDRATGLAVVEGDARVQTATGTLTADKISVNTQTKEGAAAGKVRLEQHNRVLTGSSAFYNWEKSTGTFVDAVGIYEPWRFSAQHMTQVGPSLYILSDGSLTSCDLSPPHYHIRFGRSQVVPDQRAKLYRARFTLEEAPVFWTPFFFKSLKPKKYSLRIEPGHTSRDGTTLKTIFGYPVTPNSYTRLRWDWYEHTGNGVGINHQYFLPKMKGEMDAYFIRDHNPDPQPDSRRRSLFWNHYNKMGQRLTFNAKVDYKSDKVFGNEFRAGNLTRLENEQRGLLSEAGFSYQLPQASLQAQFERKDRFDSSIASQSFISRLVLPRMSFTTIPLRWKYFPLYPNFSFQWANETAERESPRAPLLYQRSAFGEVQLRRDFRITRLTTITPKAGYRETWQHRDFVRPSSSTDIYVGRYSLGGGIRQRITRSLDMNMDYTYAARLKRNTTRLDSKADDHGIETEQLNGSIGARLGATSRLTMGTGYDLRSPPVGQPNKYRHTSSRYTPPFLDLQWEARPWLNVYFRETYSLFQTETQRVVHTPLNTSGEIQLGNLSKLPFLSQGFSYTKTPIGGKAMLILTNKLKFYLTPKWYIDFFLSYRLQGPAKLKYEKAIPIEKTISLVRDLHCWILRMEFSKRPGRTEASFYIDLKANMSAQRNIFTQREVDFYPYRDVGVDPATVFPQKAPDKK